jgi:hypothetical protein
MASTILVVRSVESLQSFRACQDRIADAIKACSQGGCHFIDGHPTHLQTVADCTGSRDVEVCSLRILRRLAVAEQLGKVGPSCLQHRTLIPRVNNASAVTPHLYLRATNVILGSRKPLMAITSRKIASFAQLRVQLGVMSRNMSNLRNRAVNVCAEHKYVLFLLLL